MARFDGTQPDERAFLTSKVNVVDGWSDTAVEIGEGGYIGWAGSVTGNPAKVEIYANSSLVAVLTNAPRSITTTNSLPDHWNLRARAFDAFGNSRYTGTIGFNIFSDIDADGDGILNSSDFFPYEPVRWLVPQTNQNDNIAPAITITQP